MSTRGASPGVDRDLPRTPIARDVADLETQPPGHDPGSIVIVWCAHKLIMKGSVGDNSDCHNSMELVCLDRR